MKAIAAVFIFCSLASDLKAGGPYRNYLLSKVYVIHKPVEARTAWPGTPLSPAAFIPRYETPRGAVFCRMEDKVTKATKVWLKIGVQ